MGEETTENYTTLYLSLFNDNLIKFYDVFGFRSSKKAIPNYNQKYCLFFLHKLLD